MVGTPWWYGTAGWVRGSCRVVWWAVVVVEAVKGAGGGGRSGEGTQHLGESQARCGVNRSSVEW